MPFPSVTVCKSRPGLEQYGFVEEALNWIHPQEAAVNASVAVIEGFVSSLMPFNAEAIKKASEKTPIYPHELKFIFFFKKKKKPGWRWHQDGGLPLA